MTESQAVKRRRTKGYAETDVFTRWRHRYCYLAKAGVKAKIKRQARRRERREAKLALHSERFDR